MHDGAMRPGADDAVKADIQNAPRGATPQACGSRRFRSGVASSIRRLRIQPAQSSLTAAPSSRWAARACRRFRRVLAGLGHDDRVLRLGDLGLHAFDQGENLIGALAGSTAPAPKDWSGPGSGLDRQDLTSFPLRRAPLPELGRIGENGDMAVFLDDGKALHDRVLGNVGAADVQQQDRNRPGQHGGMLAGLAQIGGDAGPFRPRARRRWRRATAAPARPAPLAGRARSYRPGSRPARSARCPTRQRLSSSAISRRRVCSQGHSRCAHPRAGPGQPDRGFGLGPVDGGEMGQIDLGFHLHAVAAIDKTPGLIGVTMQKPALPVKPVSHASRASRA